MKKIIIIFSIIGVLLTSCTKEILDTEPLSTISDATFWKDVKDAELALMGAYDGMQARELYKGSGYTSGSGIAQYDFLSDDGYCTSTWMKYVHISDAKFDATSWGNDQLWAACYIVIARANRVIDFVPGIPDIKEEDSKKIVAEAKVLRASIYNLLSMTYGDVPLITKTQTLDEAQVPKNLKSEVVEFIIADLEACHADLPAQAKEGRITQGAALGMLARIYLYDAQWAKAASTADLVMGLGYTLYPDYTQLFKYENENNSEVIFPVTFMTGLGTEGSRWIDYYGGRGYVNYRSALPSLINEFYCTDGLPTSESPLFNPDSVSANRDPRLVTTVTSRGFVGWEGKEKENFGIYFPDKYRIKDKALRKDSPQNFYLIRYAHVLLIKAEALAQQGTSGEVYSLINQLRDRVGMPKVEDVEGTNLSQPELLALVKHERRVETAFEGLRYFDIKRWGEIQEKYNYYNNNEYDNYLGVAGEKYYKNMIERVWQDRYNKWPIPQSELDANKKLVQNEGF